MSLFVLRSGIAALSISACLVLAAAPVAAEEKKKERELRRWYPKLESGMNFSQSTYSDNWSGGDKGSIVWTLFTNSNLDRRVHEKLDWRNQLKLAYGQTHSQVDAKKTEGGTERRWESPEKSTDLIDLESIALFTLGGWVDPFVSTRFESQFIDASDGLGRNILFNPVKLKETGGIAKQFIDEENEKLMTRLGFTFRESWRKLFVDTENADIADKTTESSLDGGFEWITDYKTNLAENLTWTSKLSLYKPVFYEHKSVLDDFSAEELEAAGLETDIADFTLAPDVDFENIFTAQVTKIISVNLYTRLVYDKYDNTVPPKAVDGEISNVSDILSAVRKSGQFKETLAIGVTYRFL